MNLAARRLPHSGNFPRPALRCGLRFAGSIGLALQAMLTIAPTISLHAADSSSAAALADLSIEQLMNESVTSVSKKLISLDQSPAAISVISNDDVRRLGITSIPEALRLVPGLDVARIAANQWAISSRGFDLQYANKLLVLMDGRSVYTPSFGGVYWDSQDMMLEDLDRIEVIRGPGATLWGANAVNGVINITSKNSKETQGLLASTTFGTEDQPSVSLRYGGAVSSQLHYRAYLKYFNRNGLVEPSGNDAPDSWDSLRGGFRADWEPTPDDLVTLQGDYYSLHTSGRVTTPLFVAPYDETSEVQLDNRGGNLLGRWTRTFSDKSHVTLQAYYDHFRHNTGLAVEERDTADIQLENRFQIASWNDVVWGLGYRFTTDAFTNTPAVSFSPSSADLNLYTAFVQDEITLVPRRLRLILGSKFEHNDYTGWEIQPSARLLWTPTERQTVWGSVSRAASTPSRIYRGGHFNLGVAQPPAGLPIQSAYRGNSNVISETLDAYEIGYRIEPTRNVSLDLAGFYNVYENLVSIAPGAPEFETTSTPHLLLPLDFANADSATTYGVEASVQWKPVDRWRLTANYTWLRMNTDSGAEANRRSSRQQVSLRSYLTLPWNLEFNSFLSYVDKTDSLNQTGAYTPIPAYLRADVGIIWRPNQTWEIGIWGQNLLDNQHPEFASQNTRELTEIPRSVVGKVTVRF